MPCWAGWRGTYCECYPTGGVIPGIRPGMSVVERARATMEAGFRAYRSGAADAPANGPYNTHERLNKMAEESAQAREGVGKNGDWCVDFHQRFDLSEAIRGCDLIKDLAPYFVEDPVRDEAFREDLPLLRRQAKVPIAAGEEWGYRWDFHKLVENHDIDYIRATLPNVGGITEMMKIAAICETHFVGIIPHFTGPIATAALVNALGTFSGPLLVEYTYAGPHHPAPSGVAGLQERQAVSERPAGAGRGTGYEAAQAGDGDYAAGDGARADLFPARWIDHQLVTSRLAEQQRREFAQVEAPHFIDVGAFAGAEGVLDLARIQHVGEFLRPLEEAVLLAAGEPEHL